MKEFALAGGTSVPVGELEAVGQLAPVGATPTCSSTLISPRVVLTAAHCVCPSETNAMGCAARRTFILTDVYPVDDPQTAVDESLSRADVPMQGDVRFHPEYTAQGWLRTDFALVLLDQPVHEVAKEVAPLLLGGPGHVVSVGDTLTLVGYATGKKKVDLKVTDVVTDGIKFRHSQKYAEGGDSGGPALNKDGWIVGVSSWTYLNVEPGVNESTYRPTYENYQWIAGIRDSVERIDAPEGLWVSAGTSSDLDARRSPYNYVGKLGIVGMGIAGSNDWVYAWYEDGTVSAGTSSDLDAHRVPYSYTLAPGKGPTDVVGLGIAGSNDWVYAWYRDGTVSAGTSSDLDAYRPPYSYILPTGKTPADIVEMGIAGSTDWVYTWYSDGTVSAGTSSDLDAHRELYRYTLAPFKTPADIVGMGIAGAGSNDWVYAWYELVLR